MRADSATDWQCPTVQIFKLCDGVIPAIPQIIYTREPASLREVDDLPGLLIVAGRGDAAGLASACMLAATKKQPDISVAVIEAGLGAAALERLAAQFDAVVPAAACDIDDLVARVARAIVTPGSIGQHIGCDWNDMRTIVDGDNSGRAARFGFGRASGAQRANLAAEQALQRLGLRPHGIGDAAGVCIAIACSRNLKGAEIKEVSRIVRSQADPAANMAIGVEYSDALDADTIEVDVFAFGGPVAPERMAEAALARQPLPVDTDSTIAYEIPAFLRGQ